MQRQNSVTQHATEKDIEFTASTFAINNLHKQLKNLSQVRSKIYSEVELLQEQKTSCVKEKEKVSDEKQLAQLTKKYSEIVAVLKTTITKLRELSDKKLALTHELQHERDINKKLLMQLEKEKQVFAERLPPKEEKISLPTKPLGTKPKNWELTDYYDEVSKPNISLSPVKKPVKPAVPVEINQPAANSFLRRGSAHQAWCANQFKPKLDAQTTLKEDYLSPAEAVEKFKNQLRR